MRCLAHVFFFCVRRFAMTEGCQTLFCGLKFPEELICGVDEVGRGCLAGPVVACAVILQKPIICLV